MSGIEDKLQIVNCKLKIENCSSTPRSYAPRGHQSNCRNDGIVGPKALCSPSPGQRPGKRVATESLFRPNGPTIHQGEPLARWAGSPFMLSRNPRALPWAERTVAPSGPQTSTTTSACFLAGSRSVSRFSFCNLQFAIFILQFTFLALAFLPTSTVAADPDAEEQAAIVAAVDRVAPAVLRIETVGGLDQVEGALFGAGPTTGLAVDADGYVISSAFNFLNKPSSILVRLPDGSRKPARLVATDRSRMLVLLKIDAAKPLPVCEIVPRREMRPGQWTIAVGRTFESDRPNIAVGILSAVNRIWGKAIQTDAAVSPNNYGGPLIDIRGRVMGVLAPLSPDAAGGLAGTEWYDSGVGFALPMEDVLRVLPRLKKGEDLLPGLAGIGLKGSNLYTGDPIVGTCHPKCPATAAGIKPGDRIVEIDGRAIARAADVKEELGRRYAGDKMRIAVLRGKERLEREITLVDKLEPFCHGFLGILPMRDDGKGVTVRYVYPNSPAAKAGIQSGDEIVSLDGKKVSGRNELIERIGTMEPGAKVAIEWRRGDAVQKVEAVLAGLPEALPPTALPPAVAQHPAKLESPPAVGPISLKTPEYANEVWAYVPESAAAGTPQGVVVWLHRQGGFDWKALLARWKPLCDRHDLILVAPKSSDSAHWQPTDVALVDRLLAEVGSKYRVDAARVAIHGHEGGGMLALLAAFHNRDRIRAVATVEAAPMAAPPENDPAHRLAVYLASAEKSPSAKTVERSAAKMREMKIPVVVKRLGAAPRYLNAEELAELARWIDTLDRI